MGQTDGQTDRTIPKCPTRARAKKYAVHIGKVVPCNIAEGFTDVNLKSFTVVLHRAAE